jgi:hypothetical protein
MGRRLYPAHTRIGLPNMSFTSTAAQLVNLAEAEGGNGGLNPAATGGAALAVLLLLLWVVTRFNRDR